MNFVTRERDLEEEVGIEIVEVKSIDDVLEMIFV